MSDRGWICPRCNAVNAPMVLKCTCSPPAKEGLSQELIDFFRKAAEEAQRNPPVYVPYPVYPQPLYPRPYYYPRPYWQDQFICTNGANSSNNLQLNQQALMLTAGKTQ